MKNNRKSAFLVVASAAIFAACSSGSGAGDAAGKDAAAADDSGKTDAAAGDGSASSGNHSDSGTGDGGSVTSETPDSGVADVFSTVTVTTPEVTPCSTNPRCGNLLIQYVENNTVVWAGEDVTDALLNECGTCEAAFLSTQCSAMPDAYAIPPLNTSDAGPEFGKCFLNAMFQCESGFGEDIDDLTTTCEICYERMVADFNDGFETCTSDGQAL
jgi:predicted small secreted protein